MRGCKNTTCNNYVSKNKYGNYNQYCCKACSVENAKRKRIATYAARTKEQSTEILKKRQATVLQKYGVDNVSKSNEIKQLISTQTKKNAASTTKKVKESNLRKYGVESTNSLNSVKNKKKKVFLEKYGVDHQLKIPAIAASVSAKNTQNANERIAKARKTCMEKYGTENPSSAGVIKNKRKETFNERYGVDNASQVPEFHEKKMQSQYKTKEFIFPSGKIVKVQGYEPLALTKLLETYDESDIVIDTMLKPRIRYIGIDGKQHYYFPDIYIPKDNLLIEVKSEYTFAGFAGWKETNLLKQNASIKAGYRHEFMIMYKR